MRNAAAIAAVLAVLRLALAARAGAQDCGSSAAFCDQVAVSQAATDIGATRATLRGLVTRMGRATAYRFQLGAPRSYGISTPDASAARARPTCRSCRRSPAGAAGRAPAHRAL